MSAQLPPIKPAPPNPLLQVLETKLCTLHKGLAVYEFKTQDGFQADWVEGLDLHTYDHLMREYTGNGKPFTVQLLMDRSRAQVPT